MVQDGQTSACYEADFYPFGGERDINVNCVQNYKFEGKERDGETQNDNFGARYYSNRFGRWLSADWSAVPEPVPYANLTNPQTLNLYAMVSDNPETFADLDGHCDWCQKLWNALTFGVYVTNAKLPAALARLAANDLKEMEKQGVLINVQSVNDALKGKSDRQIIAAYERYKDGLRRGTVPILPLPSGITTAEFGNNVMKWGTGDEAARARMQTLTREELEKSGVTKEMAETWRDFYKSVKDANPANPSAAGRAELMQRAVDLLSGK